MKELKELEKNKNPTNSQQNINTNQHKLRTQSENNKKGNIFDRLYGGKEEQEKD